LIEQKQSLEKVAWIWVFLMIKLNQIANKYWH